MDCRCGRLKLHRVEEQGARGDGKGRNDIAAYATRKVGRVVEGNRGAASDRDKPLIGGEEV